MVAAHIVEPAQHTVLRARHDDRLTCPELGREEPARLVHLVHAPRELPGAGKHGAPLELENAWVDVPVGGDRGGGFERGVASVTSDDRLERAWHAGWTDCVALSDKKPRRASFYEKRKMKPGVVFRGAGQASTRVTRTSLSTSRPTIAKSKMSRCSASITSSRDR